MTVIEMKQARSDDLKWINERYEEVGFLPSKLENELIAIASVSGNPAGLGRLVRISERAAELGGMYVLPEYRGDGVANQIVQYLLSQNHFEKVYCLPFAHLKSFYSKFGFRDLTTDEMTRVPGEILNKLCWCNKNYDGPTLLLINT